MRVLKTLCNFKTFDTFTNTPVSSATGVSYCHSNFVNRRLTCLTDITVIIHRSSFIESGLPCR